MLFNTQVKKDIEFPCTEIKRKLLVGSLEPVQVLHAEKVEAFPEQVVVGHLFFMYITQDFHPDIMISEELFEILYRIEVLLVFTGKKDAGGPGRIEIMNHPPAVQLTGLLSKVIMSIGITDIMDQIHVAII